MTDSVLLKTLATGNKQDYVERVLRALAKAGVNAQVENELTQRTKLKCITIKVDKEQLLKATKIMEDCR